MSNAYSATECLADQGYAYLTMHDVSFWKGLCLHRYCVYLLLGVSLSRHGVPCPPPELCLCLPLDRDHCMPTVPCSALSTKAMLPHNVECVFPGRAMPTLPRHGMHLLSYGHDYPATGCLAQLNATVRVHLALSGVPRLRSIYNLTLREKESANRWVIPRPKY